MEFLKRPVIRFIERGRLIRSLVRESSQPPVQTQISIPPPPSNQPWRAAVLGVGNMGRTHCHVLSQLQNVKLVAVADKSPVSLDRLPEHLRPPETRHYLDAAELLAAEPLDIVTVATTSPGHI